jgi:hypothetical protein
MSESKATIIKAVTTDDGPQKVTVLLDGPNGVVRAGSHGVEGELQLVPANIEESTTLNLPSGQPGTGTTKPITSAHATIHMRASNAHVRIGGGAGSPGSLTSNQTGQDGKVTLQNAARENMIILDAATSDVWVGGGDSAHAPFHLDARSGVLRIGGGELSVASLDVPIGVEGAVTVRDAAGHERTRIDGDGSISVRRVNGDDPETVIKLDSGGTVDLKHRKDGLHTTISLDADGGKLRLNDHTGKQQIYLHGENGNVELSTGNLRLDKGDVIVEKGDVTVQNGDVTVQKGNVTVQKGNVKLDKGDLIVKGGGNIHVKDDGDITVGGSDCAEEFDFVGSQLIDAGTVVVIDEGGALRPSSEAYDRKVAGVLSGAGAFKPGLILGRHQPGANRMPVALVGKVYCKVDAQHAAIEVGDLLTTSSTPGHAMKASDRDLAFGSVIGKALRPLGSGQGLIPILIALQ